MNIERPGPDTLPPRKIFVSLEGQAKMATVRLALADPGVAPSAPSSHTDKAAPVPHVLPAQTVQPGPVGSISGSVGDPSGAMIPHANVTLTDASGREQQVTASAAGAFVFSNLLPGGYELSVEQPGFQLYKQKIQLHPSEELKMPELLLRLGEISQQVTVSASRTAAAPSPLSAASTVPVLACPAQAAQAAQPTFTNPVQPGPAPRRIRVGGNVEGARLVEEPMPIYPDSARAAGITGTVVLKAIIGKDGGLLSTCAMAGPPSLTQSAFDAVRRWRYLPVLLDGQPVEALTEIAVVYELRN